MNTVTIEDLKNVYIPPSDSHKGQNGRMLLIGGSHLFHAASLWALTVASRIVDLVHYASVPENNEIVQKAKEEFRSGIVIERKDIESYIEEDDVILIGPGMVRSEASSEWSVVSSQWSDIHEIERIEDEGKQTYVLTNYLLKKYPEKQWVIDAGSLQMLELKNIPKNAILTPHVGEWEGLWKKAVGELSAGSEEKSFEEKVQMFAKEFHCIVLVKGQKDILVSEKEVRIVEGGNAGMTKGGTGDVLAGLIAALATKNDPFLATMAGSFINKKAGDDLYKTVGPFFNSTDLANQIPQTMKEILL